jgi:hypothetical protein
MRLLKRGLGFDPERSLAAKFAVMHNIAPPFHDVVACSPQPEGRP